MDVTKIEDHMAYACECGGVSFNLLKSGGIECSQCSTVKKSMSWGSCLDEAKRIILSAIGNNQQCFWPDIVKESNNMSHDVLHEASRSLQKSGVIRLREDSLEHAMEYILKR